VNAPDVTLGIDLGTSELKLALVGPTGTLVASTSVALTVSRPHPQWAEQHPHAWWDALVAAAQALRALDAAAWARVQAIGLSGQMHGAVLVDEERRVLRPAILWCDSRSAAQCDELMRRLPSLPQIAGNLAMPGFTAPKLMWVAQHEPDLFRRVAQVLLPKDWLRWRLTATAISDMSDAAGTLWLDVGRRAWSAPLLEASGMTLAQMPAVVEGSAVSGTLQRDAALALGLPEGLPVAGGGGDNAASAVGIGAVHPGEGFLSLGTSGVLFVVTDRYRPNPASAVHAFCHALPGRWHQMSVMLSAANGLQWIARLTGSASESALLERVAALSDAERDRAPLFLPYLSGERTPHNDPHATGVFFGMDNETDAARLGHAVIEGVGFGLADGLQALRDAGTEVHRLTLVGGGARSAHWAQLLADTLDIELMTVEGAEAGGAMGAGRLAWMALGHDERDVCRPPTPRALFRPRPERRAALLRRLERFRELYRRTRDLSSRD
jgi:xylulokinase